MRRLAFSNRQTAQPLNSRLLREIAGFVLAQLPGISEWELTFYFVTGRRMAAINETHLGHTGPTDVITFDYNDPERPGCIMGEIFICVPVAVTQARAFRTTWQSEVIRYLVHSILHLCNYDDSKPAARRKMKLLENRIVRQLSRHFALSALGN
jgi:probable rRNA maturation factor